MVSPRFPSVTSEVESFSLNFLRVGWWLLSQWWFVFVLLGVHATANDGCRNLKHVHIFREKKCAQGYSKSLRMGISTFKTYFNFERMLRSSYYWDFKIRCSGSIPTVCLFLIPLIWSLCSESMRGINFYFVCWVTKSENGY